MARTTENISLALTYGINNGEETVKKTQTFSNISISATDENLKAVGTALFNLIDGRNETIYRKETALLEE